MSRLLALALAAACCGAFAASPKAGKAQSVDTSLAPKKMHFGDPLPLFARRTLVLGVDLRSNRK